MCKYAAFLQVIKEWIYRNKFVLGEVPRAEMLCISLNL